MSLSSIVHYHRKRADLSRLQLANRAGVGKTVIYDLEHGKQSLQWNTIMAILAALKINIRFESELMEEWAKSVEAVAELEPGSSQ